MGCRPRVVVLFVLLVLTFTTTAARAQSNTRIEQNDPSVNYTGNWYTNSSSANSGGLAALTNTRGARASLAFNGNGIKWIGTSDGWAGLATVYVDGVMSVVNTYSSDSRWQRVLFEAHQLGDGPHVISIEVRFRGHRCQLDRISRRVVRSRARLCGWRGQDDGGLLSSDRRRAHDALQHQRSSPWPSFDCDRSDGHAQRERERLVDLGRRIRSISMI